MVSMRCCLCSPLSCLGIIFLIAGISGGGIWPPKAAACDKLLIVFVLSIAAGIFLTAICVCLVPKEASKCLIATLSVFFALVFIFAFAFFVFVAVVVNSRGSGPDAAGPKGYKEFRLGNYSSWARQRVQNQRVWKAIKRCLTKRGECQQLSHQAPDPKTGVIEFNDLQSGCCRPPDACGFRAINVSRCIYDTPQAEVPSSSSAAADSDCALFVNEEEKCFECDSCRAAFLHGWVQRWTIVSLIYWTVFTWFFLPVLCLLVALCH